MSKTVSKPRNESSTASVENRLKALEALHALGLDIGSQLEMNVLLRRIVGSATRLIQTDSGAVYLFDEKKQALVMVECTPDWLYAMGEEITPGQGLNGRVYATGKAIMIDDYQSWEGRIQTSDATELHSLVAVPLLWQDRVIGTLDLNRQEGGPPFTEDELWLAELFAAQASIAISNARLYEETRASQNTSEAMLHATRALNSSLDLDEVLQEILQRYAVLIPVVTGSIILLENGDPVISAIIGFDESIAKAVIEHVPARLKGSPLFRRAIQQRNPIILPDVTKEPDWIMNKETGHIRSWLGVPLYARDELVGMLTLDNDLPNVYNETHAGLAQALGGLAAVAIQNARLYGAAREAEDRFRDIALSVSDWVYEVGQDGRYTFCSERIEQYLGYPVKEVIGKRFWKLFASGELHKFYPMLRQNQELGQAIIDREVWLRHRDGHPVCMQISCHFIYDSNRKITGYRGVARDITQQKRAAQREKLAHSIGQQISSVLSLPELLTTMVDQTREVLGYYHVTVWRVDRDTRQLLIEQGTAEIDASLKAQGAIINLEDWPSLVAKAARDQHMVVSNDVLADPDYLAEPLLPDTRSEVAVPLMRGGRLLGVLDVNARQPEVFDEAEVRILENLAAQASIAMENALLYEALEQQTLELEKLVEDRTHDVVRERERLRAVVEHAGEGIMITAPDGRIQYVNRAWLTISGNTEADLVGKGTTEVFQGADGKSLKDMVNSLIKGQAWMGEMHARRPDGSEYDAATTIAPVLDAQDSIINLVAVMHDITAQKQIDRMRSKFVANVSHELRTPITNLKLYHTLITDGDFERRGEYLETLGDQLERLERLVEDLLDMSRLDRGTMAMQFEDIDLNRLVEEVVRSNQAAAQIKDIDLVIEAAPDLPTIFVDRDRIGQVLVNLITNALNYSQRGTQITLKTTVDRSDDDPRVAIIVADQGSGISPEDLPFIFERFFRAENVKASGMPGTGLGLSIVQEILQLHEGSISVQSTPSKGSTFTIFLPVKSSGRA